MTEDAPKKNDEHDKGRRKVEGIGEREEQAFFSARAHSIWTTINEFTLRFSLHPTLSCAKNVMRSGNTAKSAPASFVELA
jgi:hypothetical protein